MQKTTSSIVVTLLALCLFVAHPAMGSDEEVWWDSALSEAERDGYKLIGTKELAALLDSDSNAIIIDVRADYEHEAGHIPDSENMEFDLGDRTDLSPEKQAALEAMLGTDKQRRVVIYCRSFR